MILGESLGLELFQKIFPSNYAFATSKASTKATFLAYLRIFTARVIFRKVCLATGPATDFSNRHTSLRSKVAGNVPKMCRNLVKWIKLVKLMGFDVLYAGNV